MTRTKKEAEVVTKWLISTYLANLMLEMLEPEIYNLVDEMTERLEDEFNKLVKRALRDSDD